MLRKVFVNTVIEAMLKGTHALLGAERSEDEPSLSNSEGVLLWPWSLFLYLPVETTQQKLRTELKNRRINVENRQSPK